MSKKAHKEASKEEAQPKADTKPVGPTPIKNSDLGEKYLLQGVNSIEALAKQILVDQTANGFKNKEGKIANVKGKEITLENLKREIGHMLYDVKKEKGRWAKFQLVGEYEGKKIEPREA